MKQILNQFRWTFLLAVFKLKRSVLAFFAVRRLDFIDKNIFIKTETLREYETRAQSCAKEPETCAWLSMVSREGRVVYDIGANVGAYSLIAASLGATVFAFEPSPENYAALHANMRLNDLENRIVPLPFVLGSQSSIARFVVPDVSSGATAGFVSGRSRETEGTPLVAFTLDSLRSQLSLSPPHAIKIDVDGGEVEVLRGATTLLANSELSDILIEVEDALLSTVRSMLEGFGFVEVALHERHAGVHNVIFRRS